MDSIMNLDAGAGSAVDCEPMCSTDEAAAIGAPANHDATREEIAHLAHALWEIRVSAGQEGSADDDWLRAEETLRRCSEPQSVFADC